MERLQLYLRESYNELIHKVTWPTWANLVSSAVVVVITTLILTLIVALIDAASNAIVNLIYGLN
jgi:preprotein translocase subunit SecE